jgi:betaine reductase
MVHVPGLMIHYGTTPASERRSKPGSDFLKSLPSRTRSFSDAVAYPPNQVYIGNKAPDDLLRIPHPWYEHVAPGATREGKYGLIVAEDEFLTVLKITDSFDLVRLDGRFVESAVCRLARLGIFSSDEISRVTPAETSEIEALMADGTAAPLHFEGQTVGYVRPAHPEDPTLSAHVMLENLSSKASGFIVMKTLFKKTGIAPEDIDYILETSEEACGDMNQRGGGNFAKAIGEVAGCVNATGADVRSFCAGPVHAMIIAAGLVQSGVFRNVVVMAGGTTAKLGLNSRDHIKKGMLALEDMLGMFAVCVGENDGKNPVLRTDIIGRHTIGSGASPQAVMQAIVADPLAKAGLRLSDVDRFAPEMQNPEITEPAGAGDVPRANYKMIAALAAKKGEIERDDLDRFVSEHGVPGYAPTQGHVPSGVPFIGPARDMILKGMLRRVMIIGKGSLFLGRMTNQFDGVSFVLEQNPGLDARAGITTIEDDVDDRHVRRLVAQALRSVAAQMLKNVEVPGGERRVH